MTEEIQVHDIGVRADPREITQERVRGTVTLDATGEAAFTVPLQGVLESVGMGIMSIAEVGDGAIALSEISGDSVDVAITGGTADAEGVEWMFVLSEDGFFRDTGGYVLDAGGVPAP